MDVEMTAIYADSFSGYSPELKRLLSASFEVEPATIVATVLLVDTLGARPVAQAGLRPHGFGGVLEVKKVVVDVTYRGRGISRTLMYELETVARELGTPSLVLQTGDRQPAAIALYESIGYRLIPSYPPFELMANALCYEKVLAPL
ncbi:GNAT superfamily N-acetyltransferase [Frigoribacterium sp. CG_9.8]|nr:GNAT superfamily N-acetyltransferase [Frigoribacterium sp. CG_9.8]